MGKLSKSVEWGVAKIEALESEVVSLRGELARVAAGRPTGASGVVADPQPPAPMSSSAPAPTISASTLSDTSPPTSDARPALRPATPAHANGRRSCTGHATVKVRGIGAGLLGHRRELQQSCGNLAQGIAQVNSACCAGPDQDCSSGAPTSCTAGCAATFLPFWAQCSSALQGSQLNSVVAMCQATVASNAGQGTSGTHQHGASGNTGGSAVHEFDLVCADGSAVDRCVPACSAALRGDLLLMNLNGDDTKYSCELHHGLHSWVGAATDGGYLGADVKAFISALIAGAAGFYQVTVGAMLSVAVDLTVRPGQTVSIRRRASPSPSSSQVLTWGRGGFTVQQGGALSVAGLALRGRLTVTGGGTLRLVDVTLSLPRSQHPLVLRDAGSTIARVEMPANEGMRS